MTQKKLTGCIIFVHVGQSPDNYDGLVGNLNELGIDLSKLRYFWAGSTLPDTVGSLSKNLNDAIASVMYSGGGSGQKFCLPNDNIGCSPVFSRKYGNFFKVIDEFNPNEIIGKLNSYMHLYQYNLESGYSKINEVERLSELNLIELMELMQFLEPSNRRIKNNNKCGMSYNRNPDAIEPAHVYVKRMTEGAAQILYILSLASVVLLVEGDPMDPAAMIMPYLSIETLNDNKQMYDGQPLVFHVCQAIESISR